MPRTRRSAEQARAAILEAAGKRLREGGPEAVRLQDVARDLGVSHPAILHHFGSREGLMRALAEHVAVSLEREMLEGLRGAASEATVLELLTRVFETIGNSGHARLLAWRALSGDGAARGADAHGAGARGAEARRPTLLAAIAEQVHARRVELARAEGRPAPPREDSEFMIRLAAAAMLGDGVAGGVFDRSLGRGADAAEVRRRFRAWLARLLLDHQGTSPPRAGAPGSRPAGAGRPRGRARGARS
jgi:AcrR family transcriptional regulator